MLWQIYFQAIYKKNATVSIYIFIRKINSFEIRLLMINISHSVCSNMMNEYAETYQILPIHVQYITYVSLNYDRKSVTSTSPIEKIV